MDTFEEALNYAKQRTVVLPPIFYDPTNVDSHGNLMTVSNLTGLAQIQGVTDSLKQSLQDGDTFEMWKKKVASIEGVGSLPDGHLETVFRNFIQTSYNGGRWLNFEQNKDVIPYLMFSAINDARTTTICRHRNGIIRKVDDPFWKRNSPMLHHRCRSTLVALTGSQARSRSGDDSGLNKPNPTDTVEAGWGLKPDPAGRKESLAVALANRLKGFPKWMWDSITKLFLKIFG